MMAPLLPSIAEESDASTGTTLADDTGLATVVLSSPKLTPVLPLPSSGALAAIPSGSDGGSSSSSSGWSVDFAVCCIVLGVSEAARGVVIPILSTYVTSLPGGSAFTLSVAIALFSVGRGLSSTFFGWWIKRHTERERAAKAQTPAASDTTRTATDFGRSALVMALSVAAVGHVMFIWADPMHALWLLLISRIATGFGTGVLTIARTLVAVTTAPADRVRYNSYLGVVSYFGAALTPIVGAASISFGPVTPNTFGSFCLLLATCCVLVPISAWLCVSSASAAAAPRATQLRDAVSHSPVRDSSVAVTVTATTPAIVVPGAGGSDGDGGDAVNGGGGSNSAALWLLIIANGLTRGTIGVAETYGAEIYAFVNGPDSDQQADVSEFFLLIGGVGVAALFACEPIAKRCGEFRTLVLGLMLLTTGFGVLVDYDSDLNSTHMWIGMLFVWALGASLVQTILVSLFSKHVQAIPLPFAQPLVGAATAASSNRTAVQALWMGRITAAGSWGRIIIPLLSGAVMNTIGRGGVFTAVAVVQGVLLLFTLAYRRALAVPTVVARCAGSD